MKNEHKGDFSYYRLSLMDYLRSSFPELLSDEGFIGLRSQAAAAVFESVRRSGGTTIEAAEEANQTLFENLHFSKFDTIFEVLTEEFFSELKEDEYRPFAMKMLPVCKEVFNRYDLTDNFAYEYEYKQLYTEITGAIQIYIEANGVSV